MSVFFILAVLLDVKGTSLPRLSLAITLWRWVPFAVDD